MNVNTRPTLYSGETDSGILTPIIRQEILPNTTNVGQIIVTYFFKVDDNPEMPRSVTLRQRRDVDSEEYITTSHEAGDLPKPEFDRFKVCRSIIMQQHKANRDRIPMEGSSGAVSDRIQELHDLHQQITSLE